MQKNFFSYNILPLIILFTLELFLSEISFFVVVILFTIFSVFVKSENKKEKYFYLLGLILGFVIEIGLGLIHRQQNWSNPILFGVPLWLPFMWGLGFIYIRRIGNLIVK